MASPAHKIRYRNLQVTIWRQVNRDKGTTFYTSEPSRSYKDGDETWKESRSFTEEESLIIGELMRQAFLWMAKQAQADYKARKAREEASGDAE